MSRHTVLIVDDSSFARTSLRRLFASHEYFEVAWEASDGREAVEKALQFKPHLIIMDLQMPHANGIQAARTIYKELPQIPVILLTLHAEILTERDTRDSGIQKVVSKQNAGELVKHAEALMHAA